MSRNASAHEPVPVTPASSHHFFGYYDKSPWSGDDRHLLAHRVEFVDRLPTTDDIADIRVFDTETGDATTVGTTTAWNFQQGSMLQWLGPDHDRFVYNDRLDGDGAEGFGARVVDCDGRELRTLSTPIYACSPDGETAVTVDFERLGRTRPGYGYATRARGETSGLADAPTDDGLYRLDLETGDVSLALSLADLRESGPVAPAESGAHWVNHISYSPCGERVAFLHRCELTDGGVFTRLLTADPDGSDLGEVLATGKATHYAWRDEGSLLVWTRRNSTISTASSSGGFDLPGVRRVVDLVRGFDYPDWFRQGVMNEHFYLVSASGEMDPVSPGALRRDGHPSFAPGGRFAVLDTYADADWKRELYLYDFEREQRTDLCTFDAHPTLGDTAQRCDLHPRWNRAGTQVCVDSMHDGSRRMHVVDIADFAG